MAYPEAAWERAMSVQEVGTSRPHRLRPRMLFVRSLNGGVSHSPDELSSDEDIALALDVLTEALFRLSAP